MEASSVASDAAAVKAREAVEDLVAEGLAVTVRAVRERAGVRTAAAAQAARAHAEDLAASDPVPDVPGPVAGRFAAVWRQAVLLARAEHAEAAAGWARRLEELTLERDEAEADLRGAEAEVEALTGERDKALAELDGCRAELDGLAGRAQDAARQAADAQARAAAADARAETLGEVLARLAPPGPPG